MKSKDGVCIVFDTNIMFKSGDKGIDFSSFSLNSKYSNLVEYVEKNDLVEKVQIIVPKIVFEELKIQQKDKYYNELAKLREQATQFKGLFDVSNIYKDINYEGFLEDIYKTYIKKLESNQVETLIIDFPSNNRFPHLITRAINKVAPFEAKNKQSDKGFKDALLWESLIESQTKEEVDLLIMFSADSKFNELKEEYQKEKSIKYVVIKTESDLYDLLKKKYSVVENDLISQTKIFIKKEIQTENFKDYLVNNTYHENKVINSVNSIHLIDINQIDSLDDKRLSFDVVINCNCEIEVEFKTFRDNLIIILSMDFSIDKSDYIIRNINIKGINSENL